MAVARRLVMVGMIWAGVVLGHIVLPDGHPLRMATGGAAQGWVALGLVCMFVLARIDYHASATEHAVPNPR